MDCLEAGFVNNGFHNFRAVLFDLDGTLIDHFTVIYRCYCHALREMGMHPVSFAEVKASVGGSIPITFGKLVPADKVEEGVRLYREEFDRIWHEDIGVLPGAPWLLKGLREQGLRIAIFTNKEGNRSRRIMAHIGLDQWVDEVIGTMDTEWRKPQPQFTQYALDKLGVDAVQTCIVGDSPYDVETGDAVGIPCYVVATGSHTPEQLRETNAVSVYDCLHSLGKHVFGLRPDPDQVACR